MRTVQVIGPGGTRQEVQIGDETKGLHWAAIAGTTVLTVQQYAVGGLVVLVALRPGTTPEDLGRALLDPEVTKTAEALP